ncbi:electron transport complex subunit RsxC [Candidatus Margulisiibacteriota bacterium]
MKTFQQGIHPEYKKQVTENKGTVELPFPKKVIIPLHQHTGAICEPLVKVGDEVVEGQKIGESSKFISAAVHASIGGKVAKIEKFAHPGGTNVLSVVIERGECHSRVSGNPDLDARLRGHDAEQIRAIVKEAGIVGLGGAAFPSHVKLSPPEGKTIDTILINGCECEPYITADHRIMMERTNDVVYGAKAMAKAVGAKRIFVGVEHNKADAIAKLRSVIRTQHLEFVQEFEVVRLETKYPQGGEKMLIKALLNREVPSGGLPADVGAVVFNVGTAVAITEAIKSGTPLIKRVITVAGSGVKEPKNLLVRIGTTFQDIIDQCGGLTEDAQKVIMGGPMMGVSQFTLEVPVVKATSCILVLTKDPAAKRRGVQVEEQEFPCCKCARCVDNCPMFLTPAKLVAFAENGKQSEFEEWGGQDCIECGSCAYVCPAKIPLVQWIKLGKNRG